MYKLFLHFILFFSLSLPAIAQENEGIQFFHGTWEEGLQKARQENKLVFVDGFTVWCGPCAYMMKNVFPQKEVGDFYNRNFICMKIDMEKEGKELAKRYNVVAYPTFLFVTPEGYVAHRGMGGMKKAEDFIALGKEALKIGHNGHEERFAKGERNEAFLKEYFQEMLTLHLADQAETTLGQLYQEQGRKILRDKDYWTVFDCCAENTDSPLSLAFLKDYKKLCKIHGAFAVDQKTRNLYASISKVIDLYDRKGRKEEFSEEKKKEYFRLMEERKVPNCAALQQEIEFIYLLRSGKYGEAYALGEKVLANADARVLGNWATLGERMVRQNQAVRTQMAEWMKRAIEAGVDASLQEEAQSVLNDLTTSASPAYQKGGSRITIPIRGYLPVKK